jgi:hypothetical protein
MTTSNCILMTSKHLLVPQSSQTTSLQLSAAASQQKSYNVKLFSWDIICGGDRGFESHTGNIRFQQILSKMRASFMNMESKTAKKKLVKDVDEFIQSYGGRFLRVEEATARLRIMTTAEARNKISRSLRENVSPQKSQKAFITKISELDIMCGRGKQAVSAVQTTPPK